MNRNAHLDLWVARIDGALDDLTQPWHAFGPDEAPRSGSGFAIVSLQCIFGDGNRRGDVLSPSRWRLMVRAVSDGDTNGYVLLDQADTVIYNKAITVSGITSTGPQRETEDPVGEDEDQTGIWSGLRSYTYAF